jgi:hypothetical protein
MEATDINLTDATFSSQGWTFLIHGLARNISCRSKYFVPYDGTEKNTFLLGKVETCYPQEAQMSSSIVRRVKEALVDPEVRKAEIAKQKREEELAKMGPWLRYLEENPKLKKWAELNPAAAEKEKVKFLKKHSSQSQGLEGHSFGTWASPANGFK